MRIAVIPARGGSKRIPRKNIKNFSGKPAISWSIAAAQASSLFEKIIVSTEDDQIAEVAQQYGALVPFRRPKELADDITATVPVMAHAVRACIDLGWSVDWACCIYPCSPFVQPQDLAEASALALSRDADFVYPITRYPHPVQRAMRMLPDSSVQFVQPEHELTRTQLLEPLFHDTGQFYFGKAAAWLEQKRMHTAGICIEIPSWRVVDIDTPDDWTRAELLHAALLGSSGATSD